MGWAPVPCVSIGPSKVIPPLLVDFAAYCGMRRAPSVVEFVMRLVERLQKDWQSGYRKGRSGFFLAKQRRPRRLKVVMT